MDYAKAFEASSTNIRAALYIILAIKRLNLFSTEERRPLIVYLIQDYEPSGAYYM